MVTHRPCSGFYQYDPEQGRWVDRKFQVAGGSRRGAGANCWGGEELLPFGEVLSGERAVISRRMNEDIFVCVRV